MPEDLPIDFNEGTSDDVPVVLDAKTQKKKEKLDMLAMYPELGSKVLKVKAKALASLGKQIETLGVKKIGLASLAAYNEAALYNYLKCGEYAERVEAESDELDTDKMMAILQIQKEIGDQLIEVAQTYLDVDKNTGSGKAEKPLSLVFPSGQPMVVAVNSKIQEKIDTVENPSLEE